MPSHRIAALLAGVGLCLLPACGSDDDESSAAKPAKLPVEVTDPAKGKVAIQAPSSVKAGPVELTLTNSGKAPHVAQIVGVEGKHPVEEVIKKFLEKPEGAPTPPWAHYVGGAPAPPGKTGTAIQLLEPGTYYIVDSGDDGESNASEGGIAKLDVTGKGGGKLPHAEASITAKEYSFETSRLKAGKNRITFDNAGKEPHHAVGFPLHKGATIAEVKKLFASEQEPKGPPPVDFQQAVGTAVLDGGHKQVADIELKPGKYALVCFISDRQGGPPHLAKGMISEAEIK